jgi:hypothetical protein
MLVWNVLMQDAYFRNDVDLAEMIMNITGTVKLWIKAQVMILNQKLKLRLQVLLGMIIRQNSLKISLMRCI